MIEIKFDILWKLEHSPKSGNRFWDKLCVKTENALIDFGGG